MRRIVAVATLLIVSCSAPSTPTAVVSPSPTVAPSRDSPRPTASESPSGPVSAGTVPDIGLLFFYDFGGAPDAAQNAVTPAVYRYDGASGTLAKMDGWFSFAVGHETAAGVYVQGPNGRMDFMRWDGSRASDQEFTACQQEPGLFASWCSVSATGVGVGYGSHTGPGPGPFTGPWCPAAFIRLPGTARGTSFPPELCVQSASVSADGKQILINDVAPRPSPTAFVGGRCQPGYVTFDNTTCYERRAWIMPVGGAPRQLRLAPATADLFLGSLSPDGRFAIGSQAGELVRVDVATGTTAALGPVDRTASLRWSAGGGLAFVRGAGDDSWIDRTVVVVAEDGSARDMRFARSDWAIGLAPAWDPSGRRLAWIASPAGVAGAAGAAQDYLDGRGVGDRRVLVSDLTSDPLEIRCGDGVAEGVRWSRDATALLLVCRRPGIRAAAFDLWLHRLGAPGAASVPVVRGITWGGVDAHGFAPDLLLLAAWSRGVTAASP